MKLTKCHKFKIIFIEKCFIYLKLHIRNLSIIFVSTEIDIYVEVSENVMRTMIYAILIKENWVIWKGSLKCALKKYNNLNISNIWQAYALKKINKTHKKVWKQIKTGPTCTNDLGEHWLKLRMVGKTFNPTRRLLKEIRNIKTFTEY